MGDGDPIYFHVWCLRRGPKDTGLNLWLQNSHADPISQSSLQWCSLSKYLLNAYHVSDTVLVFPERALTQDGLPRWREGFKNILRGPRCACESQ